MSVQILTDSELGYSCLYCSTTMTVFGGIFYEEEEPKEFLEWVGFDVRAYTESELNKVISKWRTVIKEKV